MKILILAILLCASTTHAWNEPTDFKGLKFGEDLTAAIPKCPRDITQKDRCWAEPAIRFSDHPETYDLKMGPIGDRWLQTQAIQLQKKLAKIEIGFPATEFATMFRIFQERYGEPTKVEDFQWQSQIGAVFRSRRATWQGEKVSITMTQRGRNRDRGEIVYLTDLWLSRQNDMREKIIKDGAKDL